MIGSLNALRTCALVSTLLVLSPCLASVRADGPDAKAPNTKAKPAPEQASPAKSVFETLNPTTQNALKREAKYYVRLPNGTCLSAYRFLRTLELANNDKLAGRQAELEALGAEFVDRRPRDYQVKQNRLIPWVELERGVVVVGSAPGMSGELWLNQWVPHSEVPKALEESVIYFTDDPNAPKPVYTRVKISESQPTPEQLAESLVARKKGWRKYTFTHSTNPNTVTERDPYRGWAVPRVRKLGPPIVTYTWEVREVPVRPMPASAKPGQTKDTDSADEKNDASQEKDANTQSSKPD